MPHSLLLQERLDDVVFFIAINFWYIFLGFAIFFFLLSIKLFKDKALYRFWLERFNQAFGELAKLKKVSQIEDFLVKSAKLFEAQGIALYIRRGDIFILQAASKDIDFKFSERLYKKDIIPHQKVGKFHLYMIESSDEKALMIIGAKKSLEIESFKGFAKLMLTYYLEMSHLVENRSLSTITDASKNVLSSMMRFQHGTETFLKFVVSLLLKIDGVTGITLVNQERPNKVKVFEKPEKGRYKKRFFIRNTPFILDIFSVRFLSAEQIREIGSFLDMAGAYFENADENSKMVANYINFLRLSNRALELQSQYFKHHSQKVKIVAVEIAKNLFLDERSIDTVALGAELHDIGMVGKIENFIDSKEVDKHDLDLIRYHPLVGGVLVEPISHIYNIVPIIKYHHERFDGSGYPYGLKGKDIPMLAQIVALAEYYVGRTSPRAYRKAASHEEAIEDIQNQKDELVEAQVIDAFLESADSIKKKLDILDAE